MYKTVNMLLKISHYTLWPLQRHKLLLTASTVFNSIPIMLVPLKNIFCGKTKKKNTKMELQMHMSDDSQLK